MCIHSCYRKVINFEWPNESQGSEVRKASMLYPLRALRIDVGCQSFAHGFLFPSRLQSAYIGSTMYILNNLSAYDAIHFNPRLLVVNASGEAAMTCDSDDGEHDDQFCQDPHLSLALLKLALFASIEQLISSFLINQRVIFCYFGKHEGLTFLYTTTFIRARVKTPFVRSR